MQIKITFVNKVGADELQNVLLQALNILCSRFLLNPSKLKITQMVIEHSVRTSKKIALIHYKDELVNVRKEIIVVYSKIHVKPIKTKRSVTHC
jgi:hypothetical protein